MLKEIRCDKFAPNHQVIKLNEGLNTVLGSSSGTNAIGKSTFLWVIDYAFGGDRYYSMSDDIKKEIGPLTRTPFGGQCKRMVNWTSERGKLLWPSSIALNLRLKQ
jgi:hypothetical protein